MYVLDFAKRFPAASVDAALKYLYCDDIDEVEPTLVPLHEAPVESVHPSLPPPPRQLDLLL